MALEERIARDFKRALEASGKEKGVASAVDCCLAMKGLGNEFRSSLYLDKWPHSFSSSYEFVGSAQFKFW